METAHLALILETVVQLDREVSAVRDHVVAAGRVTPASSLVDSFLQTLAHLSSTVRRLRDHVLAASSGDASSEQRALALRTRCIVITMQLAELARAEREVTALLWPADGPFQSLEDVLVCVFERVDSVQATWLRSHPFATVGDRSNQHARVEGSLVEAEQRLSALGRDPHVACFLAAGASVASERFRTACRVIAAMLDVQLAPSASSGFAPTTRRASKTALDQAR